MSLFLVVVVVQFIGAVVSHSRAMMIDAASMLIDVATYATNLWVECAPPISIRQAEVHEVAVSGVSLLALWTITLIGATQAIATLRERGLSGIRAPEQVAGDQDVDGRIVLGFALLNIAVDVFSLLEFNRSWRQTGKGEGERVNGTAGTVEAARSSQIGADARTRRTSACARVWSAIACCALDLNMSSALTHVLADTFRSITTLIESLLILGLGMDSVAVDDLAAIIVAAAIMLTALGTTKRCAETCRRLACTPRSLAPLSTREAANCERDVSACD
jgi:Co/Zn/Cd efflux system component